MREGLDHWTFVITAYVLGVGATLLMAGLSWIGMKQAEARRDRSREK